MNQEDPMVCRILHEIYLAAFINNCQSTLIYLNNKDPEGKIFTNLLNFSMQWIDCQEEWRIFIIAFTFLMTQEELPDYIKINSPWMIEGVVNLLVQTSKKEAKKAKQK